MVFAVFSTDVAGATPTYPSTLETALGSANTAAH